LRKRIPAREYVDCIQRELDLLTSNARSGWADPGAAPRGSRGRGPDTIYLGGGTPSLLPPEAIAALLGSICDVLGAHAEASDTIEITLEANPDDVTAEAASAWRRAGVNRVSLGAQSFDDRVLTWMHRTHDATRIEAAVRALRNAGIENVSLDLIFALPEELQRDWHRDLDLAVALRPSHVSIYGLTVEPRTPLARWIDRGQTTRPDDERYAAEYLAAHERLGRAGYHFYEVSNAALGPHRSRHNAAYWSGRPYLGLGPAAHSFDGQVRRWNLSAWEAYRRNVLAGRSPVDSEESLTGEQRELERLYLALRTDLGLPLTARSRLLAAVTARWLEEGWVEERSGRLVCLPEGWLRLDALVGALTGGGVAA
jgi:oxygen-independent coproporphyrinogen-3 oxidase